MIKEVRVSLHGGDFCITEQDEFSVDSNGDPLLVYVENSIAYVVSDPNAVKPYNVIMAVPHGTESVNLDIRGGTLRLGTIRTGTAKIHLNKVHGSADLVAARRILCSQSNGDFTLNAQPTVAMTLIGGFGSLTVNLPGRKRGYNFDTKHGAGGLFVNNRPVPRIYRNENPNGIHVTASCGLGTMRLNTNL